MNESEGFVTDPLLVFKPTIIVKTIEPYICNKQLDQLQIMWFNLITHLEKGKHVERRGRKATGLRPQGYDGRVAKSRSIVDPPARQPTKQVFLSNFITGRRGLKPSPTKANLAKARDAKPRV
jgi:hypothetical protein